MLSVGILKTLFWILTSPSNVSSIKFIVIRASVKTLRLIIWIDNPFKDDKIIIQGDYRDKIMTLLKEKGFNVKRVGG